MNPLRAAATRLRLERYLGHFALRFFVFLVAVRAFAHSMFVAPPLSITSGFDDHYFLAHEFAARTSLVDFHELPSWNPFYCGGVAGIANPQDVSTAPDFLLRIFFGVVVGRKLAIVLFLLMGMEGTFRLAKKHGSSVVFATAAAIAFSTMEWFKNSAAYGWVHMYSFQLLPWALLFLEEGFESKKKRWFGAAIIAWMLMCGGTYTVPFTLLALALTTIYETVTRLFQGKPRAALFSPLRSAFALCSGGALLGAIRVFPLLPTVFGNPRVTEQHPIIAFADSLRILTTPGGGMYFGNALLVLALIGLFFRDKRLNRNVLFAALFFWLTLGESDPSAPFSLLKRLPLYSQLRAPDRYHVVVALFLALAAARSLTLIGDFASTGAARVVTRALSRLRRRDRGILRRRVSFGSAAVFVLGSATASFLIVNDGLRRNAFAKDLFVMDSPTRIDRPFHQARGNRWDAHVWSEGGRGSLQCFEETKFPQSPLLRGDLKDETYLADASAGRLESTSWSPHRLSYRASISKPTTLLVNQNYSKAWRANVGTVREQDGLLAVDLPPGEHSIELEYKDRWVTLGILVSLTTLVFAIRSTRHSPRRA